VVEDTNVAQPNAASDSQPSSPAGPDGVQASPPTSSHVEAALPEATQSSTNDSPAAADPNTVEQPRSLLVGSSEVPAPDRVTPDNASQESAQESLMPSNRAARESADSSSAPAAIENPPTLPARPDALIPNRPNPASTLRPELRREVEMIVRQQEDDLRRKQQAQPQPVARGRDTIVSDLRAQTQLDISRAPSPAEARPIKAIPVPEDWEALKPRNWAAQRKYWAAAATCHLPLYFQDPVLERYGHSVEQFFGPVGRYLTYPLDDPTQSTQRNQILQPFFSAGLFAFQIAALPYNVLMDPPWEAQYDLGYYRPGDNVPTDTYWLPLHGYGPPLRGSNY
jgi:hypothetical protein